MQHQLELILNDTINEILIQNKIQKINVKYIEDNGENNYARATITHKKPLMKTKIYYYEDDSLSIMTEIANKANQILANHVMQIGIWPEELIEYFDHIEKETSTESILNDICNTISPKHIKTIVYKHHHLTTIKQPNKINHIYLNEETASTHIITEKEKHTLKPKIINLADPTSIQQIHKIITH